MLLGRKKKTNQETGLKLGNPKAAKVILDIEQKSISVSEYLTVCQNSLSDFCFNILISTLSYFMSLETPSHSPPLQTTLCTSKYINKSVLIWPRPH